MIGHEIPDRPWQKVSMDLFEFNGDNYIAITDYYSKFFEVSKLTGLTAKATIRHIKPHFARYGIPEEVISDNGPQFDCKEFKDFAQQYGFTHTTSSPHYPKSNGHAERTVQSIKKILKKAWEDGSDPNLALLSLRNTPIEGIGLSQVQMLMGRRTRTRLPTNAKLLLPDYNTTGIKTSMEKKQLKQKVYYDRGAKPLQPLQEGENVKIRDPKTNIWQPGQITHVNAEPRSYTVESNGGEYRRNRSDILKQSTAAASTTAEAPNSSATTGAMATRRTSGRLVRPPNRYGFNNVNN